MTAQHRYIEFLRRALQFCAQLDVVLGRDIEATAGLDDPELEQADSARDE